MGNFKQGELLLNSIRNEIKKDNNFFNYIGIRSLREGNFEDGWKFYESRGSKTTSYLKEIKEWNGENLKIKVLLYFMNKELRYSTIFKICLFFNKNSKKVIFM